jgi:hypothetical protein
MRVEWGFARVAKRAALRGSRDGGDVFPDRCSKFLTVTPAKAGAQATDFELRVIGCIRSLGPGFRRDDGV